MNNALGEKIVVDWHTENMRMQWGLLGRRNISNFRRKTSLVFSFTHTQSTSYISDHQMWYFFFFSLQFSTTPAGCPMSQFSSTTIYLEVSIRSPKLRGQFRKTALTSDIDCKSQVVTSDWLAINHGSHDPLLGFDINMLEWLTELREPLTSLL